MNFYLYVATYQSHIFSSDLAQHSGSTYVETYHEAQGNMQSELADDGKTWNDVLIHVMSRVCRSFCQVDLL